MPAVKLTPAQFDALDSLARGYSINLAQKSISLMVERGLITFRVVTEAFRKQAKRKGESWYDEVPVTRYYLTEGGFEAYSKILDRRHVRRMKDLRMEHCAAILRAKGRVLPCDRPVPL